MQQKKVINKIKMVDEPQTKIGQGHAELTKATVELLYSVNPNVLKTNVSARGRDALLYCLRPAP